MRSRALTALVAGVLLVAGCASIPDEGGVHRVASDGEEQDAPVIYDPPGPTPGADPEQLVDDFLTAMQALPVSPENAREFLTEEARGRWDPTKETVVYAGSGPSTQTRGDDRVELTFDTFATLDRQGAFTPGDGAGRTVEVSLKKVDGEWRIDRLPNVYLVSETLFEENFQQISLYFLNESQRFAVPLPVYLPGGDQLATYAVTSLLRGPPDSIDPVATTAIPEDTTLDVSVRVRDDGRAEVRLVGPLDELQPELRERMAAQIVLTLRQIPGVTAVQLLVNGVPYDVPGTGDVQDIDAWNRFDTSVAAESTPLFAIRDERLVVITGDEVHEVGGPDQFGGGAIGDFGIDRGMDSIAIVNPARTQVRVGSMADESAGRPLLTGSRLLAPRWDALDWLWIVDAGNQSTSVAVSKDERVESVPIGPLAGMRVRSAAVSPDGSRFAAIATEVGSKTPDEDAAVYTGLVRRSGDGRRPVEVMDVRRVPVGDSGLHAPRSVAWRDATSLVVLAEQRTLNAQPFIVSIDGSSVSGGVDVGQPSLPNLGVNSVAASGRISDPIYVGDDDGGVWQLDSNQRWSRISDTSIWTPHFAG